ncbi:2-(3-amino-3-carboxypropyl)histidine synthase [Nematocida parisii]|nr:2-(3-amino-3-carboxypropyl)histidine synthase [Nematocida parisii]
MNILGSEYLPPNYKFELQKTIRQIERRKSKRVAIQFPEGIIHLSTVISDIIRANTDVEAVFILSDVVYGAYCIDDVSGYLIDCDLLIHYGHSCLFEVTKSLIQVMYIFVEIQFDITHCLKMINKHIKTENLSILGTIQYNSTVRKIKRELEATTHQNKLEDKECPCAPSGGYYIPRMQPLSPGEVLGCTSPKVSTDTILFIAEGRFHLESLMIHNPNKTYYKYCPSSKKLSLETHDYGRFLEIRKSIKRTSLNTQEYVIIFGTLGRQGSAGILKRLVDDLNQRNRKYYVVFLSEVDETFVESLKNVTVIEVACPRIAIDWGTTFEIPIITPFEYFSSDLKNYPMDYYMKEEEGQRKPWQSLH